jgi:uncharacterized protein YecE (DUF72 family)
MTSQLGLFGASQAAALAETHEEVRSLAASLPPNVFLGTSSWAFPGWQGIVYSANETPSNLARNGLLEYSRHPLLRTVEIDRSYYAPVPPEDLRRYAEQLPSGYRCCIKAPATVTSAVLPARTPVPQANPDYLSVELLERELLEPLATSFADHAGPIVLQFPPQPARFRLSPRVFADRLDHFLERLPRDFRYSVEVRDPQWLTPEYGRVLARHGVAHTYSFWSSLPMPAPQESQLPISHAPFTMLRLMLPPGTAYEGRRENFRPFDRLAEPHPEMRKQVVALIRKRVAAGGDVFVIANNKAEGSAPLTVRALAEMLVSTVDER